MYVPEHFREDRIDVMHALIRHHPLAQLVGMGEDGLEATPVPLLLETAGGPFGTLQGHVALANPFHRISGDVLALFQGPDAYVSPSWYPTKMATGKVVPTWNYVVVQAAGQIEFYRDRERLRRLVTRLTETHEAGRSEPWAVTDAPGEFIDAMLNSIIGFEIPIRRLEGKSKLSQNRSAEDRAGVAAGLAGDDSPLAAHMADGAS
jgi:transcriptional regulator